MDRALFSKNFEEFTPTQQYSLYVDDTIKFSEQNDLTKIIIRFIFYLYDKNVLMNIPEAMSFVGFAKAGTCYALLSKMSKMQFYPDDQGFVPKNSGNQWLTYEDQILFASIKDGSVPFVPSRSRNACKLRLWEWKLRFIDSGIHVLPCKYAITETISLKKTRDEEEEENIDDVDNQNNFNNEEEMKTVHQNYQTISWNKRHEKRKIKNQKAEKMRNSKYLARKRNNSIVADVRVRKKEFPQEFLHILEISKNNCYRKPSYDCISKRFWLKINSLGRQTFNFFKYYMNGPSRSTVYEWTRKEDYPRFEDFLEIENTEKIIEFWRKCFNFDSFAGILSIDAMKIDEDLAIDHRRNIDGVISQTKIKIPENIQNNYSLYINLFEDQLKKNNIASSIFIASICPLCSVNSFPLYIYLSKTSSADKNILEYMQKIIEPLKNEKIHIVGISTDSDQSYIEMFNIFYNEWSKHMLNAGGDITRISINNLLLTNDCPHLLKRARSRLITKKILFADRDIWYNWKMKISDNNMKLDSNLSSCVQCITKEQLQEVNDLLLDYWFRNNGQDAMDDFYPHNIFSPRTLVKALEKDKKCIVLYVSPLLMMIRILRDKEASREQRLIWCYTALYIFQFYHSWLKIQCCKGMKERKKEDFPSIFSMDYCIDSSNYLFSMIKILSSIDKDFSIGRVGTITSEHLFSQLRCESGNEQTIRSIRHAFNRLILRQKYGEKKQKIENRLFSSAKSNGGAVVLDAGIIKNCIYMALKICENAGLKFSRECFCYELIENLDHESGDLFYEKEFEILCQDNLKKHYRNEHWRIQISQVRRTNKIGREIKVRYSTKISE